MQKPLFKRKCSACIDLFAYKISFTVTREITLDCILSKNSCVVEFTLSVEEFSTIWALQRKKVVKMRFKEEYNNIFELVGLPKIDQQKVEALKGILKLVLVAQKLLLELMEELAEVTTE